MGDNLTTVIRFVPGLVDWAVFIGGGIKAFAYTLVMFMPAFAGEDPTRCRRGPGIESESGSPQGGGAAARSATS